MHVPGASGYFLKSVFTAVIGAAVLVPIPSSAQSNDPSRLVYGFWNVEWRRAGEQQPYDSARIHVVFRNNRYHVSGCHTVYRSPAAPDGRRKAYCGWRYRNGQARVEDGGITIKEPAHVLGSFGGTTKIRFLDADTAEGSWRYQRGPRRAAGTVTWRRSKTQISRVVFNSEIRSIVRPGEVAEARLSYDDVWTSRRGYREGRPTIAVEVYGTELWGKRYIGLLKGTTTERMLEIYDRRPIVEPVPDDDSRTRRIGLQFRIAVWRDAKYGRKQIIVDRNRVPFDFVVNGHPDLPRIGVVAAIKESDAVKARVISLIPDEGIFWFRAEYVSGPGADAPKTKTLVIRWQGSSREITLTRSTEFPRFYLAGPYYGVFPADNASAAPDPVPENGGR